MTCLRIVLYGVFIEKEDGNEFSPPKRELWWLNFFSVGFYKNYNTLWKTSGSELTGIPGTSELDPIPGLGWHGNESNNLIFNLWFCVSLIYCRVSLTQISGHSEGELGKQKILPFPLIFSFILFIYSKIFFLFFFIFIFLSFLSFLLLLFFIILITIISIILKYMILWGSRNGELQLFSRLLQKCQ